MAGGACGWVAGKGRLMGASCTVCLAWCGMALRCMALVLGFVSILGGVPSLHMVHNAFLMLLLELQTARLNGIHL